MNQDYVYALPKWMIDEIIQKNHELTHLPWGKKEDEFILASLIGKLQALENLVSESNQELYKQFVK